MYLFGISALLPIQNIKTLLYKLESVKKARYILNINENDLIQLTVEGYNNNQIAEKLGVTNMEVREALKKVYEKHNICNRVQLTFLFLNKQLKNN